MMSASGDARMSSTGDGRSATGDGRSALGDRACKRRAKGRRDAVRVAKDFANPSTLSDRLWEKVRVSVNSLSHDRRPGMPGKKFR